MAANHAAAAAAAHGIHQASLSPWSFNRIPTPGSRDDNHRDEDSLTLAPFNPISPRHLDNEEFNLPSLDDSHFFDALIARDPSNPLDFSFDQVPTRSNQQQSASQSRNAASLIDDLEFDDDLYSDSLFADLFGPLSSSNHASQSQSRPSTNQTSLIDLTASSPEMPPSKKRKRDDASASSSAVPAKTKMESTKKSTTTSRDQGNVEVLDLENVEGQDQYEDFRAKQQAEAIRKQNEEEANKPIKLSEFQCIICMDNPTNLTVTHCGHLFCSECLHSALHAGDKKCCPVCRATITLPTNGKRTRTGIYPLEMKLMTATRKGKQPAASA